MLDRRRSPIHLRLPARVPVPADEDRAARMPCTRWSIGRSQNAATGAASPPAPSSRPGSSKTASRAPHTGDDRPRLW